MKERLPLIVVYHADCIDGAGAAWAVSKSDMAADRPVSYIPYGHTDHALGQADIRKQLAGKSDLVFVDIAPHPDFMSALLANENVGHVTVLDHHKTAAEEFAGFPPSARLTVKVEPGLPSAAKMVWGHLMPHAPLPDVIVMIDKMDGDATGLVTADDFAAAACIDGQGVGDIVSAFAALDRLEKLSFRQMADSGAPMILAHERQLDKVMASSSFVTVTLSPGQPPVSVPVIEADVRDFGRAISRRLVALGKEQGPGVSFCWRRENGGAYVSIRTDGNPDASKIAEHFCNTLGVTGGGHAAAAAIHFARFEDFNRLFLPGKPPSRPGCRRP